MTNQVKFRSGKRLRRDWQGLQDQNTASAKGAAVPCVLLRPAPPSVYVTECRRAFFYLWKGVKEYEPEVHLSRLWNTLGL